MKKILFTFIILSAYNGTAQTSGSLDMSFGTNGKITQGWTGQTDEASKIIVQTDGKLLVLGSIGSTSTGNDFAIMRLNQDGTFDNTFGTNGKASFNKGTVDYARNMVQYSNGSILIAGASDDDIVVFKLNSNGTIDNTFGTNGYFTLSLPSLDETYGIDILSDGKILISGHLYYGSTSDFFVARLNSNGSLDNTFASASSIQGLVSVSFNNFDYAKAVTYDFSGNIYVSGVTYVNGKGYSLAIAKIAEDGGSLITTFGTNGKNIIGVSSTNDELTAMILQSDGTILLGGKSDVNCLIVKLTNGGILDNSFGISGVFTHNPGFSTNSSGFNDIKVQPDGKIVGCGFAGFVGADPNDVDFVVLRINSNGVIDGTFNMNLAFPTFNNDAKSLAIQSDGKIVVVGGANVSNQVREFAVVRYYGISSFSTIDENYSLNNLMIFPNPVKETLHINVNEPTTLCIQNSFGQIIHKELITSQTNLSLNHLSPGIYFISTNFGEIQKLIKE